MSSPSNPLGNGDPSTRTASVITTPLIVVSVVFPFLSAGSIYIRLAAKRRVRQPYHADDWWIIATWFLTLSLSILFWVFAAKSGVDTYGINGIQGISDSLTVAFLTSCLLQLPLASVKISVLLFYKRIFEISQKFSACVWVAISVVAMWFVIFTVLGITLVDPISETFHGGRVRYDMKAMGLAQSGSSIALDILVLCFPLPIVFRMLLSTRKKVMIFFMFWLGAFCCIAAATRLYMLKLNLDGFSQSPENIHRQSTLFVFLLIEPNCSIIAACLPCYGPFMGKARSRTAKSNPNSERYLVCTHSQASTKGAWLGGRDVNSEAEKSSSPVEPNSLFGWPSQNRYKARCASGEPALQS